MSREIPKTHTYKAIEKYISFTFFTSALFHLRQKFTTYKNMQTRSKKQLKTKGAVRTSAVKILTKLFWKIINS